MEIAERRHHRLSRQFDVLTEELEVLDSHVPSREIANLIDPIESGFSEVEKRKELLEIEPEDDLTDYYQRYVSSLDDVNSRINMLHSIIGYVELHSRQREDSPEVIDDIQDVCQEIAACLGVSTTILPVIWRSYEILSMGPEDSINCLFLPRHNRPRQYQPVIAHEIGHVLHEEVGSTSEFNNRVWTIDDEFSSETGEFAQVWMKWFEEFFCDACGVIAFGPAYVLAMADYLHNSYPYWFEPSWYGDYDENVHPPEALRFEFVELVAEQSFSESAQQLVEDAFDDIDKHLVMHERNKPSYFDNYAVEELFQPIFRQVRELVSNDIEEFVDLAIADVPLEQVNEDLFYRVKINRAWLQNGG